MSDGGIGGYLDNLRKSKNGLYIGLAITALLALLLMLYTWYICFSYMAIALVMYGIPTWFGLKDKKKLAVFGLVLLLFLGLAWGFMMASNITSFGGEKVSADQYLTDGTVSPVWAESTATYNFTVSVSATAPNHNVTLLLSNNWAGTAAVEYNMTSVDSTNTSFFVNVVPGDKGIYSYVYRVWNGQGWTSTGSGYGPITASHDDVLMSALSSGLLLAYLQIGMLFFILIFLTWWMDKSKVRMEKKMEETKAKKASSDDKFVCSECGSDVPADADKCPQCGERFDEEKPEKAADEGMKCPKCGAAIFETDKKCWNCGKVLENKDQK